MTKYTIMACVAAVGVLALGGCSDDSPINSSAGHGNLAVSLALDGSVKAPRQSRAGESGTVLPAASDLSLRLVSSDGSYSKEWENLAAFSSDEQFKVGNYTLEAWYGTEGAEGYDCAHYYGSCPVKIDDRKTTTVALTAALSQALVDVNYSESFDHFMSDYSAKVNGISLPVDETRPVHVTPGTVSVKVDFTKPNGDKGADYEVAKFTAKAQTHYHVNIDLAGGAGDASIVVTYDDEMDTQEVIIDISDMVMNSPAPVLTPVGFTAGTPIEFVSGMAPSGELMMNVIAQGGLKEVNLATTSPSLIAAGWPAEIDLLAATAEQKAALANLGFSALGVFTNPGSAAVLNFSEVPAHITSDGGEDNSFTLTVKDKNFKVSESLTLDLKCQTLVLEISGADPYQAGEPLDIQVAYNGSDMANNVVFKYKNERNTWTTITDVTVSEPRSRTTSDYTVTLGGIPASYDSVELVAACGEQTSNSFVAKSAPFYVSFNENDVYSTSAFVTVEGTADETRPQATLAAGATYFISSDGSSFRQADGTGEGLYTQITGLQSSTTYTIKAKIDGIFSKIATFTTESDIQVPNAGMEDWVDTFQSNYYGIWWAAKSQDESRWGTANPMTTSQGANYEYVRCSGTLPLDNNLNDVVGHTGKAAHIRTIGWGSGNSATGSKGTSGKCKYTDAGLLHLGQSRTGRYPGLGEGAGTIKTDDLDCGIDFASRPAAISFWYRYEPKNPADQGRAEYWIKDSAGNIIKEGGMDLPAAGNWTEKSFNITYTRGTAKGARLYLKFTSTNDDSFLTRTDTNFSGPGFANLSHGKFLGSSLYIDDINLTY